MGQANEDLIRKIHSLYQQNRDLINLGAYQRGSDTTIDQAIDMQPDLLNFLSQDMNQAVSFGDSYSQLVELLKADDKSTQEKSVDTLVGQQEVRIQGMGV